MADYGIKASQPDKSVFSDNMADIIFSTEHPFAKIDPTTDNTFTTVQFTFVTNPALDTETKFYSLPFPYDYAPMMWQIWWDLTLGATPIVGIATGRYISGSGATSFTLYTKNNTTDQTLDFYVYNNSTGVPLDLTGLTGTYSNYIFVDDLTVT